MKTSELKDFTIIVTSDEPYSKMWHTQLIYTEFLSKTNKVIYIDPPKKWRPKNIFSVNFSDREENENLTVIQYVNRLPVFFKYFDKYNEWLNEKLISKKLCGMRAHKILVWHFDSYRNSFLHQFFSTSFTVKRIYHVIDPFYKNPIDRLLCRIADKLVITSPRNNFYYSDFSEKLINVPQCLDIKLQKQLLNGHSNVKLKFRENYFVLLGTISDDIDFDWILSLLTNNNFKLIIIGKVTALSKTNDFQNIINHENVDYLGLLSPIEFYPILNKAIAGMIIYNEERRAKVCSPLKALNYIIAELPVITNIDCEIPELTNNAIYYSETSSICAAFIECVLNKKLELNMVIVEEFLNKVSISNAIDRIVMDI